MTTLSESERRLVEEADRVFGTPLGAFLLAGCGEDKTVHRRAYVVSAREGRRGPEHRYVELRAGGSEGLARGREPLAWAAVLRALSEGPRGGYVVGRHHRQVLEALGLEDTADGRALVERALDKYLRLTVVEARSQRRTLSPGEELLFVSRLHPVVEYLSTVTAADDEAIGEDASFRIEFSQAFSAGLTNGGLFGAEWVGLRETEPAAWDGTVAGASEALKHIFDEIHIS